MEQQHPRPSDDVARLIKSVITAINATISSLDPILFKAQEMTADLSLGISLLLLRPQILLASLHNLVSITAHEVISNQQLRTRSVSELSLNFHLSPGHQVRVLQDGKMVYEELRTDLLVNQILVDKIRGLEGKLDYQIKKLVALAEAQEARKGDFTDDLEDPLSFRPRPEAMVQTSRGASSSTQATRHRDLDDQHDKYRPPRVAAVPYNESSSSRRTERRAPALLSEFAATVDGAPILESTSGLSTRPVQADKATNSISAKRAAELERMNKFEEENFTRLVTSKREAKRRAEDEAALALGYGVGGPARSRGRRQNGLEAELEGVLGERRARGLWEGVSGKMGKRDGILERGKRSGTKNEERGSKKARFEKDMGGSSRK